MAERQQVLAQDSTGDDVLLNGTARGNERRRRKCELPALEALVRALRPSTSGDRRVCGSGRSTCMH